MIAPTPIAVSWVRPTARLSSAPSSPARSTSDPTSRIANTPAFAMLRPLTPSPITVCPRGAGRNRNTVIRKLGPPELPNIGTRG
ncbi:hypothetical protein GCM10009828_080740 [Actinoplanes couchii]